MEREARFGPSEDVSAALEAAALGSFAAIRRLGEPARVAEQAGITLEEARAITDHARLALITEDRAARQQLVDAGLTSISGVAQAPLAALARQLPDLGAAELLALKQQASAVSAQLQNRTAALAGQAASRRAGYGLYAEPTGAASAGSAAPALMAVATSAAPCAPCASVLSPGAYLVDLLDFLQDVFLLDLDALDDRFRQVWSDLPVDCAAAEDRLRQVRIASAVLERFILDKRPGVTREEIYGEMADLPPAGDPPARPNVLIEMFDAYLAELSTSRGEIAAAIDQSSQAVEDLAARLHLSVAQVMGLNLADSDIGIAQVEAMPALLRTARTAGIDPQTEPDAYREASERAEAAIGRVEAQCSAGLRDNLVRLALLAAPAYPTARALGDSLHIDLASDAYQFTTRVAQAIATIHAFVQAYRLGREPQPNARWNDRRWRWMQSYGTWHAAQTVFWYPENFTLPGLRRNQTPQFQTFLDAIEGGEPSPAAIRRGVADYEQSVVREMGGHYVTFAVAVDDRAFLFSDRTDAVYYTQQTPDGDWQGWAKLELELAGRQLVGAAAFNGRIYLFFRPNATSPTKLEYTWMDPDRETVVSSFVETTDLGPVPFDVYRNRFIFLPGTDHLTVYFLEESVPHSLRGGCMDRFHRWWVNIWANDQRFGSSIPPDIRAVGHLAGRDYLVLGEWAAGKLWLIRIDNPYAKPVGELEIPGGSIGAWTLLRTYASGRSTSFAGTVRGDKLIVTFAGGQERLISEFLPAASPAWISLDTSFGALSPLVAIGDRLLLSYGANRYVAFSFYSGAVTKLATGLAFIWQPDQLLMAHPVAAPEATLAAYQQGQLQLYTATSPGDFARLLLDEWYLFIPLAAARALNGAGSYQDAADWFHVVYNPYRVQSAQAAGQQSLRLDEALLMPDEPGAIGTAMAGPDRAWEPDSGTQPRQAVTEATLVETTIIDGGGNGGEGTTPPTVEITSPPNEAVIWDPHQLLTVTVVEGDAALSGWLVRVQPEPEPAPLPGQCTWPITGWQMQIALHDIPGFQQGFNTIRVWVADGHHYMGTDSISVMYDPTPPGVAITTPTNGAAVTDPSTLLQATITEPYLTGWCIRVQQDPTPEPGPADWIPPMNPVLMELRYIPGFHPGSNTIRLWARDFAGNVGTATISVTYQDVTAPSVTIRAPTDRAVIADPRTLLRATIAEPYGLAGWCVREQFSPDPAPSDADYAPVSGASPYQVQTPLGDIPGFRPGSNTLRLWAKDVSGNVGSASIRLYHPSPRFIYAGFNMLFGDTWTDVRDTFAWMRDPLNPHAIARTRPDAYLRHTVLAYVDNVLDWADYLFSRDTGESTNRARELYELALDLLGFEEVATNPWPQTTVDSTLAVDLERDRPTLGCVLAWRTQPSATMLAVERTLLAEGSSRGGDALLAGGRAAFSIESEWVPALPSPPDFCVLPNLILDVHRFRAESSLAKIRTGRNVAGLKRRLASYAMPVEPLAAVTAATGDAEDGLGLVASEPPPIYRYAYLLERARYFIAVAQQLEAAMLVADEKEAAESYNLLKARQDQKIAQANVQLHGLRLQEAQDSTELARRQWDRVDFQRQHFETLIQGDLNGYEQAALGLTWLAMGAHAILALAQFAALQPLAGLQSAAAGLSTGAQFASMQATFERRREEWTFQRDLAGRDLAIADQQITLAEDREDIVGKEGEIASLHNQHAADTVNFLTNKFTNVELYRWMSRTLRRIYQQQVSFAVAVARMAQQALSFERQEPVHFIGDQYWDAGRKGLLGAENLLSDLNRLDQHRFSTEQRKRELTKTISLASVDPVEFRRLQQAGMMELDTLLEWFDRDFPGHYLRLIKNVSLTFVALIPPVEGIHATLGNTGLSRVMVGPPFVEPRVLLRQPEAISVTVPNNGTGLFEVNLRDELLLPFEGSGVETSWRLELPPGANRFDYQTLVDVLLTIRYTALDDWGYRQKVLDAWGADQDGWVTIEGRTFFSARNRFPDQWYQFQNPAVLADPGSVTNQTPRPYSLRMDLTAADFPPHELIDFPPHETHQPGMTRLIVAAGGTPPGKVPVEISFTPAGASTTHTASAELEEGRVILASSQALPLDTLKPFGAWTIRVRNEANPVTYPQVIGTGGGGGRVTWDRVGKAARVNVALAASGSTASASSTYDVDYRPDAVINGDRKGTVFPGHWADNTPGVFPDWIEVQLPGAKVIDEIDVLTTQDAPLEGTGPAVEPTETLTFARYGITAFEVQYWSGSGATWVTVPGGAVTGNDRVWRTFTFPAITTDRVRVLVQAAAGGVSRVVELEAYESGTHVNVTLAASGGQARASSVALSYPTRFAINGDRLGRGWVGQTPFTFPGWLQVDFNGMRTIDEVDVFSAQDPPDVPPTETLTFTRGGLTEFEVQYWNDTAWVTVPGGSVSGNNKVWRKVTFPPVTTDKVRVLIHATSDGQARLIELEAYGYGTADTVWLDDALPAGATPVAPAGWTWVSAGPAPASGARALQSAVAPGTQEYAFSGATAPLVVNPGDVLFAHAYLDPSNPPSEIMLQWYDGSWEHRAYWGANNIARGTDGTASCRRVGPLPTVGRWVRLEVPAAQVGLENRTVTGMALLVYGERQLDLSWLTDILLVLQYRARTRYVR